MHVERRRKRSSYTHLALQYWLASVAQRNRLVAMVLADTAGLVVAGSMLGPEAEELAAVTPLLMREDESGCSVAERHQLPMKIEKVSVEGDSLYLCAVGDQEPCSRGIDQARSGISRILG
jgi:hypothetical protein